MIRIGIVGATGVVGCKFLQILTEGVFSEIVDVVLFSSTAGVELEMSGKKWKTVELSEELIAGQHIAIFTATTEVALEWVPIAVRHGVYVVDNSAAFRMDEKVPLVVPEVNGDLIRPEQLLYSNPNCCVALMVTALKRIHHILDIQEIVVDTYQAVSGAGIKGIEAMQEEAKNYVETMDQMEVRRAKDSIFPVPCLMNVFPHNSPIDPETGYSGEELKIITETQKLLGKEITVIPTCARVSSLCSHAEAITFRTRKDAVKDEIYDFLRQSRGVKIVRHGATTLDATDKTEVLVGRVRKPATKRFQLWICGDQLLKGAAWNAYQIMSLIIANVPELNLLRQKSIQQKVDEGIIHGSRSVVECEASR